ncbi:unnamed protein product [Ascophyllum nodosum]
MADEKNNRELEVSTRKMLTWRRQSPVNDSSRDETSRNIAKFGALKATARRRVDEAMRAYTDALGELREDMQPSHFETWTLEQMQEFLVSNDVELRGAIMLARASFLAILEKMFEGATPDQLPRPPEPLTEEFKKRREKAARLLQDWWFLKKREQWKQNMERTQAVQPEPDRHLQANPLPSPRGVLQAAARGRISEGTPWEPPSIEEAKKFRDEMHPRRPEGGRFNVIEARTGRYCFLGGCGEQLDLWDEGKISHFAPFGAGVTSYFKFLKYCCWSFFVVSCAVIPHLLINTNGRSITAATITNGVSWTTIGNLGSSIEVTEVVLPFCDEKQYSTCKMDKDTLGTYYGYIDAGIVILLLAGYFWVNSFITDEFKTIKRNTVTAADFTIMVDNIPPDVTEEEISTHFCRILNRKVAEVAIARDNRRCISLYGRSGRLYHQRAATRDLIRYLKTKAASREYRLRGMEEASVGVDDDCIRSGGTPQDTTWFEKWWKKRQIRRLQTAREKASRKIISLTTEAKLAARTTNIAVAAYVTFEEEMGAVDARVLYSGSSTRWIFMEDEIKLRGHRIRVCEAPEPSTIMWENFGFVSYELWLRRFFTFVVSSSFLTLSVGMSIGALYQTQLADDMGGTALCPTDWDSLSSNAKFDAVHEDRSILHCLCKDRSTSVVSLDPSEICFEYTQTAVEAAGMVVATSLIVAITNGGINKITKMMGAFDKHTSMDKLEVSTFRRLVILKFVNIGLTVLITNSRRVIDLLSVNLEYENDFTPDWYRTLGSSLVMNVLINAITPHLYWLVMWTRKRRMWKQAKSDACKVISQDALHEIAKGLPWEISHRYAEITVIFAVCLAYSAGIPLLLPVGAASFLVFYWVEKALFVNFYTTPPQYSGELTHEVINLIPFCLWVHTVVAFYMYGNGSIFPVFVRDDQSAEDAVAETSDTFNFLGKLRVNAVQPLLLPFVILSIVILERWLGRTTISGFGRIIALLTCKGKIAKGKLKRMCNTVTVDYSRAVVRGILRGLPSYNILLNPKYKESFGLSDTFAAEHKRVGSIFKLLREHPSVMNVKKAMQDEMSTRTRRANKIWSPRKKNAESSRTPIERSPK